MCRKRESIATKTAKALRHRSSHFLRVFFLGGGRRTRGDLAQDVAVDVLGAAKNVSVKVFILKVVGAGRASFVPSVCSFKHAQRTHAAPTLPLSDTPNKRVLPQTLALSAGRRRFCRGTRRRMAFWAPRRTDRHLSAAETSPSQPGLPQTAPIPMPPRFLYQRFFHRRALFERLKPFVGAAHPVALAVDT